MHDKTSMSHTQAYNTTDVIIIPKVNANIANPPCRVSDVVKSAFNKTSSFVLSLLAY